MIILIDGKDLMLNPDLSDIISNTEWETIEGTFGNTFTFTIQKGEYNKSLWNNKNKG